MYSIELDKKVCDLSVQELKQIITDVVREQVIIIQNSNKQSMSPIYYKQDVYCECK